MSFREAPLLYLPCASACAATPTVAKATMNAMIVLIVLTPGKRARRPLVQDMCQNERRVIRTIAVDDALRDIQVASPSMDGVDDVSRQSTGAGQARRGSGSLRGTIRNDYAVLRNHYVE